MTIWLYCICFNEAPILPYTLRHYSPWVDRMQFFDGGSRDGTVELIQGCPKAECHPWPGSPGIVDDEFLDFANTRWKEARGQADWVIWIDADEFLYHPQIYKVLERYKVEGVTLPLIDGCVMISDHFPTTEGQIHDEIKTGIPDNRWAKRAIFNPAIDMKYTMGRHNIDWPNFTFTPSPTPEIKLLHYRYLGTDYVRQRHFGNWGRVPERCRLQNLGANCSPNYKGAHSFDWYLDIQQHPERVSDVI